jgi:acyl-CoA thioesterase
MSNKSKYVRTTRENPFGALLKFEQYIDINRPGHGRCVVDTGPQHYSPGGAVHGGMLFTIMDNCMGASLVTTLKPGEGCATIEMKINYLKAVFGGKVESSTRVLQKGKRIAVLESQLRQGNDVVAIATSTYAIFQRPTDAGYNAIGDRVAAMDGKTAKKVVKKKAAAGRNGPVKPLKRAAKKTLAKGR